jgi:hypothetical protein
MILGKTDLLRNVGESNVPFQEMTPMLGVLQRKRPHVAVFLL